MHRVTMLVQRAVICCLAIQLCACSTSYRGVPQQQPLAKDGRVAQAVITQRTHPTGVSRSATWRLPSGVSLNAETLAIEVSEAFSTLGIRMASLGWYRESDVRAKSEAWIPPDPPEFQLGSNPQGVVHSCGVFIVCIDPAIVFVTDRSVYQRVLIAGFETRGDEGPATSVTSSRLKIALFPGAGKSGSEMVASFELPYGIGSGTVVPYDPCAKWFVLGSQPTMQHVEQSDADNAFIPTYWGHVILTRKHDSWLVSGTATN